MVEVVVEAGVDEVGTLGGLDEDEVDGLAVDVGIAQTSPVDDFLIATDVDAANFVAVGADALAVDGVPAE